MQVELKGVSQDISLEDGSSTYFLVLRLPAGQVVRALITEDTAKIVLGSVAGSVAEAPSAEWTPPPTRAAPSEEYPEAAHVFGGEDAPEEEEPSPPPAPAQPAVPVNRGIHRGRAPSIPQDEMGYPMTGRGADPGEVVGVGTDVDEDGVGQA